MCILVQFMYYFSNSRISSALSICNLFFFHELFGNIYMEQDTVSRVIKYYCQSRQSSNVIQKDILISINCQETNIFFIFSAPSFDSEKYRRRLTLGSYTLSLLWTTMVVIVEYAAPTCAPYRPKFGYGTLGTLNSCFFQGYKQFINLLFSIMLRISFVLSPVTSLNIANEI